MNATLVESVFVFLGANLWDFQARQTLGKLYNFLTTAYRYGTRLFDYRGKATGDGIIE